MQNVGTPRIYVDHINYQKALGVYELYPNVNYQNEDIAGLKNPSELFTQDFAGDVNFRYKVINDNI